MKTRATIMMALVLLGACTQSAPAPGPERHAATPGEAIYSQRCVACHMIEKPGGETVVSGGKIGPNHWGVIGRGAGTQDFPHYSRFLVAAGEKGLVWSEAELVQYLADPRRYLRAYLDDDTATSRMAFKLASERDRKDVAAYLATMR